MSRSVLLSIAGASLTAVLIAAGTTVVALPAFASVVEHARFDAASQHLDLAAHTDPIRVAPRDGVTMTSITLVQWPIDPATRMSSGFGRRIPPCGGCSSMHSGVDLVPGAGTPIAAIADGTVVKAGFFGDLGEHVMIRHDVNGETVTSVYGHMIAGSLHLAVGDHVTRGDRGPGRRHRGEHGDASALRHPGRVRHAGGSAGVDARPRDAALGLEVPAGARRTPCR
ncbi:M23 family metallopeptidase [Pseudolysinimonas kribbensis]|uniref:M23 family metallopeptidase n=1 Tax=Pseudolysinimonas kribbensis TaxID=433641 RepID=UPI0024E0DCB5|nr:M23 family metallopeptidase [Pseudolysinimonas kribbensis]